MTSKNNIKNSIEAELEELVNSFKIGIIDPFSVKSNNKDNIPQISNENNLKNKSGITINSNSPFHLNEGIFGRIKENFFQRGTSGKEEESTILRQKIHNLIEKYDDNEQYKMLLKNVNLFKWMKCYALLTNTEIRNIELVLAKLRNYSFNSNTTLCEIKAIDIIDCIQVLTVIDFTLKRKKIILTKIEGVNINENVDNIIDDYLFKVGDILICSTKNKIEKETDYIEMNVKEIQKIGT